MQTDAIEESHHNPLGFLSKRSDNCNKLCPSIEICYLSTCLAIDHILLHTLKTESLLKCGFSLRKDFIPLTFLTWKPATHFFPFFFPRVFKLVVNLDSAFLGCKKHCVYT
jgi:hypothetical protein